MNQAALAYRLRWRADDPRPGKHPARQAGDGGHFQSVRPFWQVPDARRIDIRRSIVDPFGGIMVRQTEQRSSIALALAVDVSHSMRPAPSAPDGLMALAEAAARAASRAGDGFALITFDRTARGDGPPVRTPGAARRRAAALSEEAFTGRSAEGIGGLAAHLPARRCLVLLVSDFLMPAAQLESALAGLDRHDIAPVIWNPERVVRWPAAGLLRVRDVETGRRRLLLMRPSLRRRWQAAAAEHAAARDRVFARFARAPFMAGPAIDLAALSAHLMQA